MWVSDLIAEEGPGALGGGVAIGACLGGLGLLSGNFGLAAMLFALGAFAGTLLLLFYKLEHYQKEIDEKPRLEETRLVFAEEDEEKGAEGSPTPEGPEGQEAPPPDVHLPTKRQSLLLAALPWPVVAGLCYVGAYEVIGRGKEWLWNLAFYLGGIAGFGAWGLLLATRAVLGRRLGVFLDREGLTVRRAGFGRAVVSRLAWGEVRTLGVEKDALTVDGAPLKHDALVLPAHWIVVRAREFQAWKAGRRRSGSGAARQVLLRLDEKLAGARCTACRAPLAVVVAQRQPPCAHCGAAAPLAADLQEGLAGMAALFARLRRQNGEIRSSFLRQLLDGDSRARWRVVGPATQALVLALVTLVPFGLAMWLGFGRVHWDLLLPPVAALGALGAAAWLGWSVLEAVARRHLGPLAAVQVSVDGAARCRCCGAPLGGSGVVRECAHCRGANVVGRSTARRAVPAAREAIREALQDAGVAWLAAQRRLEGMAGGLGVLSLLVGAAVAVLGWTAHARGDDWRWYALAAGATALLPAWVALSTLVSLRRLEKALQTGDLSRLR